MGEFYSSVRSKDLTISYAPFPLFLVYANFFVQICFDYSDRYIYHAKTIIYHSK